MGKRKTTVRSSSDGAAVYPVFVDTNLDTHLALIVSDEDTIADLKKKIKLEHPRCFPVVGKVKIKALQVKRRGNLYRLSDSMLVKSAFGGVTKSWFVYVDASSSEEHILKQHIVKPDSSNLLALPWVTDCPSNKTFSKHHESSALQHDKRLLIADQSSQGDSYREIPKYVRTDDRYITDNHWRTVDSDSNKKSGLEVQKYDTGSEGIISKKRHRDTQRVSPMEGDSESVPPARKKRKTKTNKCSGNTFEKDEVLINGTSDVTSKADVTNHEIFCLDQGKSRNATSDDLVAKAMDDNHISPTSVREKKKNNKKRKDNIISVKSLNQLVTVVPEVQNIEEKRTFKENVEDLHNHRGEHVQEVFEGIKAPFMAMDFSKDEEGEKEVFPTPLIKELHDMEKNGNHSAQNNIGVDGRMFEGDQVDKREQNKDVLLSNDPEVKLTEKGERLYLGDKDASYKEPRLTPKLSDPKAGMESENVGKKKKRKTKKSSTNEVESVLKDVNEGVNHVSISVPNPDFDGHLMNETREEGSILSDNEGKEISEEKAAEILQPMETNRGKLNEDVTVELKNIGVDDQMFEVDQDDKCKQNKDVLLSNDAEVKLTERGERVHLGKKDTSYKEPRLTSKLSDPKVGMESENVGKKKKRKTKKSSTNEVESVLKDVNEGVNHVSISVPNPDFDGHLMNETREEGSILSDNEGKEISEEKAAEILQPMETNRGKLNEDVTVELKNIGVDDQMFEVDQDDKCKQNKDVLLSNDAEVKLTERGECVHLGKKDASYKQPRLTSKLSDPKVGMESENVGKKKKRKTKKSSTNEVESVLKDVNEGVNHVSISVPNPDFDGHLMNETREEGSILSDNEGKEILEEKAAEILQPTETNRGKLNEDVTVELKNIGVDDQMFEGDQADKCEQNKDVLLSNDAEVKLTERGERVYLGKKDTSYKEPRLTSKLSDPKVGMESENVGKKKKHNTKKSSTNEVESVLKDVNVGVNHVSISVPNHLMDETRKEGSILSYNEEKETSEERAAEILQPTETNRVKLDEDVTLASKECENANGTIRKKKKVKKSAAKEEDASVMKPDTAAAIESTSVVPNPASDGHSMEILQKDECVPFMEGTRLPEEKALDAPQVPDRGSDDVTGKEAGTLRSSGTNRSQESENEKIRTRRKKKQVYSAMSFQGFPSQEQEGDRIQENAPRTDKGKFKVLREVTVAAKSITSGLEQSNELELEAGKSNVIEHVSSLSQKIPMDVCLSEVPPSPVIETVTEADTGYQVNDSNGEGKGIDFKQYFVPAENRNEGAPDNKVKEAKKSERLMKSKKNKEKVDVPSVGTSPFKQKSLVSANNHGDEASETKFIMNCQSQKPLSVVENNGSMISSKKSPVDSVDEMKAPHSHPVDRFKTPKRARQSAVVNRSAHAAKRNNGSLAGSSSNSDSSVRSRRGIVNNKHDSSLDQSGMAVGKNAVKNTGEAVNNSQRMKSLLATPGTIFGDDSSNSSADDNGTVDSDASTCTPSDKALSSESEGESDSSLDTGKNGSYAAKRKGRRSYLVDSQSSDMVNKSIGEILRSSSRFKKAKLTASQYQEDTEDIDFVPDSQPISL